MGYARLVPDWEGADLQHGIVVIEFPLDPAHPEYSAPYKEYKIRLSEWIVNVDMSFTELTDVPNSYTNQGSKLVRVNVEETGLEFIDPSSLPFLTEETDPLSLHLDQTTPQTVINGVPIFQEGINTKYVYLSGSYTDAQAAALSVGSIFYNSDQLSYMLKTSSNTYLNFGEELTFPSKNGDSSTHLEGTQTYLVSGSGNFPVLQRTNSTIGKCDAMATQDVLHTGNARGQYCYHGQVRTFPYANVIKSTDDPDDWQEGVDLYICNEDGKLSNIKEDAPAKALKAGKIIMRAGSNISFLFKPTPIHALEDLSNVDGSDTDIQDTDIYIKKQGSLWKTVSHSLVKSKIISNLDNYRGLYDASVNAPPSTGGSGTAGAIMQANYWVISVAGTIFGQAVVPGQEIKALVDSPGTTSSNWNISGAGGGGGGKTISKNNTFAGNIALDVDEKYYNAYTQTGTLDITLTNTNGKDSWAYLPINTNGFAINLPLNFILVGGSEYNKDAGRYELYVWTNGDDYFYRFIKVGSIKATNPSLLYAKILASDSDAIQLTFDRIINISTTGWSIATDGAALSISSVSQSGTCYPIFALSRAVYGWETITISYDDGIGSTQDANSNLLLDITNFSVYNRVDIDLVSELGAKLLRWYKDSRLSANRTDDTTGGTTSCAAWIDYSSNASNAVTATKGYQPLVTVWGLKFDGSDDRLTNTLTLGACEIFFVQRFHTATTANRLLFATQGTNRVWLRNGSNPGSYSLYSYANSSSIASGTLLYVGFNILRMIVDGANSKFNDTTGDFGASPMNTTTFSIGSDNGSSGTQDYAIECIITQILTADERNKVVKRLTQVQND